MTTPDTERDHNRGQNDESAASKRPTKPMAFRRRLDAAMADFRPPGLQAMIKAGRRVFPRRERVTAFRQDRPDIERVHDRTLPELLADIRRKRPRGRDDRDWGFVFGGKRDYVAFGTTGPRTLWGTHPVWRGRKFEGCMRFELNWKDVRTILEKIYGGVRIIDAFVGYIGSFVRYEPGMLLRSSSKRDRDDPTNRHARPVDQWTDEDWVYEDGIEDDEVNDKLPITLPEDVERDIQREVTAAKREEEAQLKKALKKQREKVMAEGNGTVANPRRG